MKGKSSDSLQQTIETYELSLDQYISNTPLKSSGQFKEFIDTFLTFVSPTDEILELGSGTGRDATYCIECGYFVQTSDVVHSFITYMQNEGLHPIFFDALKTKLEKKFDAIMALAVFLHFDEEQLKRALHIVQDHLKSGGNLALRMKWGTGEEIIDRKMNGPRYFRYWQPEELEEILVESGFVILNESNFIDKPDGLADKGWLQYVAKFN